MCRFHFGESSSTQSVSTWLTVPCSSCSWWSSVEGYTPPKVRTAQEKEATRLEARRLLQLQAPEGLKVALGPTATTVALGRLHDCLQGPGAEAIISSMMLDYLRLLLL